MHSRYEPLADTVSQDTGVPTHQILLLRHASENVRALLRFGGTIEEYTALQPVDSRYDFLSEKQGPVRVVVVIVQDRIYDVFEVRGVEGEGTTYQLASAARREFDLARAREDRQAKQFDLVPLTSRAIGHSVRGWEGGRTRTAVQRWNGGFFREVEVDLPAEAEEDPVVRLREDLVSALSEADVPETTRTALAQARIGQGRFRRALMAVWEGACAVSGCDVEEALVASHCKPWREASNAERLDPANGLLLVATLDVLFDVGLIAFSDDGQMLLDTSLTVERRRALGIEIAPLRIPPNPAQREFLRYHREHVFRGAAG